MTTNARRPRRAARRGMSILEFLACLTALAGGVVLGSFYLGVDVKEMAYVALEQVHVLEPRPKPSTSADATSGSEPAAPVTATPVTTTAPSAAPSTSATAAATPQLIESTPAADASPAPATEQSPAEPAPAETPGSSLPAPVAGLFARADLITPQQRHALTLAYWEALAACMLDEEQHRVPAIDQEGNWQLFDYLTGRKDGHLKASAAIDALDSRGVDDHVLAYAKKAHAWHLDGARLFGRAVDLLTDAPTAQLSGPFAQSWQSAATQHRMEARLLVEKQQAVLTYLEHAYDGEPAAAQAETAPAAPATP
jgi:hypothetical protein